MHAWLRNLPRSAKARKQKHKNRRTRPASRSKFDSLNFQVERLEDRMLLSITTESGATISPTENVAFSGSVATFTSPGNGPFTAVINWGDNSSTTVSGSSITGGPSPAAFTVLGSHTYTDELAATNLVTTITDTSDSKSGTATGSVTVGEGDTLATGTATVTGTEGQTVAMTATFINSSTHPSPNSDFTAEIDWGDGTTSTVSGAAITGTATLTVSASHLYVDEPAGNGLVFLIDDSPGTAEIADTLTTNIKDADTLTAAASGTITATVGAALSTAALATFSDTYTGNTASGFAATINWGDGTTTAGTVAGTTSGGTLTLSVGGSHTYATAGSDKLTITLSDPNGTASATATPTVTISAAPSTAPSVSVKISAPTTAVQGSAITYTLTLANSSATNAATNVALVDQLDPSEHFFSVSDTAGTKFTFTSAYPTTTGEITGTVASIGASSTDTVTIVAVADNVGGTITDNASISIPSGNAGTPISASAMTSGTAPTSPANLVAEIAEPSSPVVLGQVMEFGSFVENNGSSTVNNVPFSFQIDPNQVLVSASDADGTALSVANDTITGTIKSIAAGGKDTFTIIVDPTKAALTGGGTQPGTVTNGIVVASPSGNNSGQIFDSAVTIVDPLPSTAANVTITKTGPTTAAVGAPVSYTVTLANAGSTTANNILVGDPLAANETLFSASDTAGTSFSFANGQVTGTVSSIAAGSSDTITIVTVPTSAGTLSNTAYTSIAAGNQANNVSSPAVNTTVSAAPAGAANLTVTKTGPATANVGDLVSYSVKIANSGGAASNVQFSDTFTDLTIFSVSDTAGSSFSVAGNPLSGVVISGTIASIAAGSSDTITIAAIPAFPGTATDPIVVAVPGGNAGTVANSPNNTTINVAGGSAANVNVTKTISATAASPGTVGDVVTETITVANAGSAVTNVALIDTLPSQELFLSATDSSNPGNTFTFNSSIGAVTGTIASIGAGATDTVTISVVPTATSTAAAGYTDTATIGISGGNQGNNSSTPPANAIVNAAPSTAEKVSLKKTAPATGTVGDLVSDTITLTNGSTTAATTAGTVTLFDVLGPNQTFISGSDTIGSAFSFNAASNTVIGFLSSIPASGTDTVTINVVPTTAGTMTDTANVAVTGGNLATAISGTGSTTVAAAPVTKVNVAKTAPATAVVGGIVTETVTITNAGASTATNVAFTDNFFAGNVALLSATDTAGSTLSFNSNTDTITGTIGSIASGTSGNVDTVTITYIPLTPPGTVTDVASITVPGGNSGTSSSSASTTINAATSSSPSVTVAKNVPANVPTGSLLTTTVTLTNNGTSAVANVAFIDQLSPGQIFFSASDTAHSTFTLSNGDVTGTVASIGTGAANTDTITIVSLVTGATGTSAGDTAVIGVPAGNQMAPSVNKSVLITAGSANVSVKKSAPTSGIVGTPITDTVTLTNSGAAAVTNVAFIDTLPANVSGVSASDAAGDTFTFANGQITGNIASLATGTSTVSVVFTPTAAGNLADTAAVGISGGNTGTISSTATTTVVTPAHLSISKTGTPATVNVGGTETYTITISNSGGTAASGATVTDQVPAGLTNVQATDTAGTVTISGNKVTDNLGTIAANTGTETLTITATAAALASGTTSTTVSNTANLAFNGNTTASNAVTTTINSVTLTGIGLLAGQPGDGTIQTFVQNLYRELLGREPDTSGDDFWVSYLTEHNNAAGQSQVIQGFLDSPEYAQHYVTTLYNVILGRAPDAGGLQFWTQAMGQPGTSGTHGGGVDEKDIVAGFFGSDEFFSKSGNTAQSWVNALYEDLLGRAPDTGGAAYWANQLAIQGAANAGTIVAEFLTTPEASHHVLDNFYAAAGGTASTPLAAPGTPAGAGQDNLGVITGAGWENLYLQGPFDSSPQGNDSFFATLAAGGSWDDVQLLLLETSQFYTNPNRPVTK
jgi:uncharacterized repeat protein (TIGR01451 family)